MPAEGAAEPSQEARAGASVGAVAVTALVLGAVAAAARAGIVVAGTAAADVTHGLGLLAGVGTSVLLVKVQHRSLNCRMGVAGSATTSVEAGRAGLDGLDLGGNTRGSSGHWGAEGVACSTSPGVSVGVLEDGGVRLGDEVGGRHCVFLCVWFSGLMWFFVERLLVVWW